jgi:hypothetical protein
MDMSIRPLMLLIILLAFALGALGTVALRAQPTAQPQTGAQPPPVLAPLNPPGRYLMQTATAQPADGGQVYCYLFDTTTGRMHIFVDRELVETVEVDAE